MIRILIAVFAFIALNVWTTKQAEASHAAGGEITYIHKSGNVYTVRATFYRFCSGIAAPTSLPLVIRNSNNTVIDTKTAIGGFTRNITEDCHEHDGEEVPTIAAVAEGPHVHDGYCIQEYVYQVDVTFPDNGIFYISYSVGDRNTDGTIGTTTGGALFLETMINTALSDNNSSPHFTNAPIGFLCANNDYNFNNGGADQNGNTLKYKKAEPKISETVPLAYKTGYDYEHPFGTNATFILDEQTGAILAHPLVKMITVMAIKVEEYNANNQLIGYVVRDIQMNVETTCSNTAPTLSPFVETGLFSADIEDGTSRCLTFTSNDSDEGQTVSITYNGVNIPTAVFTSTAGPRPTGKFCYQPNLGNTAVVKQSFTVTITDDGCPSLPQVRTYTINVLPKRSSCKECISSFYPSNGESYVLSAWVKQGENQGMQTSYKNAYIRLEFEKTTGINEGFDALPGGQIIDGWQRIERIFEVPTTATAVNISLKNGDQGMNVYFDDIRIHPIKANMKSFVYDPITLKLMAELDENNYSTFFEYDHEGDLVRVKKETERGIMTIKEARNSSPKKK